MKLFFYVEGQEEELFVNRVWRGHLGSFGVIVQKPILAATSFRIGDDTEPDVTVGGVTNYEAIRDDIQCQFATGEIQAADVLTTLIDLYALPASFPGHKEALARGFAGGKKAAYIEQAWKEATARENFFPYIQVHEFEALVLTRPSVLTKLYPKQAAGIEELHEECGGFVTPDEINERKETSPSHRILAHVPTYQKIDGFRHLQDIGLPEIKKRCPRFKVWLDRCESFFR